MEQGFGSAWFWNPARWGTADGAVPWPVFLVAIRALDALQAKQILRDTLAAQFARITDPAARKTAMSDTHRTALED